MDYQLTQIDKSESDEKDAEMTHLSSCAVAGTLDDQRQMSISFGTKQ